MTNVDLFREQAGEMMRRAAETSDPDKRDRFFDLAARWHTKALEAEARSLTVEDRSWVATLGRLA